MNNVQLLDYIKQQSAQGIDKETIQNNLTSSGWVLSDINEAFSALGINQSNQVFSSKTMPPVPIKYAGFWIRWVASVIDGLVLIIPTIIVGVIIKFTTLGTIQSILTFVSGFLVSWVYFILMTNKYRATLGKKVVGIQVVSDKLEDLSLGQIILRETVGKIISAVILYVGYIMAGFTQKKQALHDYITHSVVVYKDPSKSNRAGLIIGIIIAAILPAIAILGILSTVVLVSLNAAREKAKDAKIISNFNSIRTGVELYYASNNGSYSSAKDCSTGMFLDQNIQQLISSISSMSNEKITCYAEDKSYAISAGVQMSEFPDYCVDSSGYSGRGEAFDDGSKASCQESRVY